MPGRQIARYALRGNCTAFFFNWAEDRKLPFDHRDVGAQKELLAQRFGGAGWETDAILAMLPSCSDLYFDSVSQIRMNRWSTGRVALLGDAAFCPSLLTGQGTTFAMIAAYILAGELDRAHGDFARAFKNYDATLRTFIESKQQSAPRFGSWLVPRTKGGLWLRNQVTRLMSLPFRGLDDAKRVLGQLHVAGLSDRPGRFQRGRGARRDVLILFATEQTELRRIARRFGEAEMTEGMRGQQPTARGALQITALDQIGFDNVLDGVARL